MISNNKESATVMAALVQAIPINKGKKPEIIKSDNGGEFRGKVLQDWAT